ncbi:hypothetical protein D3C76_1711760 [compost metagenome]
MFPRLEQSEIHLIAVSQLFNSSSLTGYNNIKSIHLLPDMYNGLPHFKVNHCKSLRQEKLLLFIHYIKKRYLV